MIRKLLFSVCSVLFINTVTFGQSTENKGSFSSEEATVYISFCGAKMGHNTMKYKDLLKCKQLTVSSKDYKIKSFGITAILHADDDMEAAGIYIAKQNRGSKLSDESIELIEKLIDEKGKKLIIEDVMLLESDGKTIKRINGMEIILEK